MKILLFLLLLNITIAQIPNCASFVNNKCTSCYYGWKMSAGRCDNCDQGFTMVNSICLDEYSFNQIDNSQVKKTVTTASTNIASNSWQSQGTGNVLSINSNFQSSSPSFTQTSTVTNSNQPATTVSESSLSGLASNAGASTTSSVTFDITNTGVMYLLQLFGLNTKIPLNCQIFTSDFKCITCRSGFYIIQSGACISISTTTSTTSGSNTQTSSQLNQQSTSTSTSTSISSTNLNNQDIQSSNQNSQTSTQINQMGGALLVTSDAFCKTFNSNTRVCSQCYFAYYYSVQRGFCVPVNPQCRTWNSQGHCLSCYSGYQISGTQCSVNFFSNSISQSSSNSQSSTGSQSSSSSQTSQSSQTSNTHGSSNTQASSNDLNCFRQNADNTCSECYSSFYYDAVAIRCVSIDPLCRTSNKLGFCLSCYQGYILTGTRCIIQAAYIPSIQVGENDLPLTDQDPNCNTYRNRICTKCSTRYYMDQTLNRCLQVDSNCKDWADSGICRLCYPGYQIFNQKKCRLMYPQTNSIRLKSDLNTDINCLMSDQTGKCTQCIFRFVLNISTKLCIKVNDLCKTWNQSNALCTGCYGGYSLTQNGQCKLSW